MLPTHINFPPKYSISFLPLLHWVMAGADVKRKQVPALAAPPETVLQICTLSDGVAAEVDSPDGRVKGRYFRSVTPVTVAADLVI